MGARLTLTGGASRGGSGTRAGGVCLSQFLVRTRMEGGRPPRTGRVPRVVVNGRMLFMVFRPRAEETGREDRPVMVLGANACG